MSGTWDYVRKEWAKVAEVESGPKVRIVELVNPVEIDPDRFYAALKGEDPGWPMKWATREELLGRYPESTSSSSQASP